MVHVSAVFFKKSSIAYALLILTTLFWAGNIVVGKGLRDAISPVSLAFFRWALQL